MTVKELLREQITELKVNYMMQLVNEGVFADVMDRGYNEPDWDDILNADSYVSDDTVFEYYNGIDFVNEDFYCTA